MATAQFSGQYGHNMTLEVWSDWNRQDVASNSSTVNVQARLRTNGYASLYGVTADLTVTINGVSAIEHPAINIGTNSSQLIFGHDYNVPHNGYGTKTVGIQISVGLNVGGYGSSMVAFDLPLAPIQRASTGKVIATELGKVATITIDRKNSSFKHTLRYNWDGLTGTIASNVDTSYSWTLPLDFANTVPNTDYHWGTVYIDTYSGSTKIGTSEAVFNATIPASMTPTLGSITLTDSNTAVKNLLNTANTFAEIVSDIKVAFNNATGVQGSTITGYHAEIVNRNQSTNSNNGNLGLMKWNGSAQVKAWVVDSRGRSSNAVTADITVLEYFLPTLTFTAVRGDTNQSSDKIVVTRTAKIAPLKIGDTQKNSFKLTFKTAPFGTETFTVDTNAGVNDKVTHELINSQATLSGTFDVGKSYEVYGVLEDALTSSGTVKAPPVSPEKMVMGMAETAVSFGKYPENTNAVDSDWVFKYKNKDIQHYQLTSNDGRSPYNASGTVDLDTKTVNEFFSCNQPLHGPVVGTGANEFYVAVYSESDSYLSQQAIQKGTGRMFTRTRHAWTWSNWIEYAQLNSVAEFTTVNQTKVYTGTINGPYGFNIAVTRSGNIVTATMDYVHRSNTNWNGTGNETIPVGWRPVSQAIINAIGEGGGGTGATLFNGSYVHLAYKPDGSISGRIKLEANPLWFGATISWITTDPFPAG